MKTLVAGILLVLGCILQPAQAGLEDVLKQAVDKEREKRKQQEAKPAEPAKSTEPAAQKEEKLRLKGYSEAEEIQIGRQIAGNLLGAAPLVKDTKLQQYVNKVGRWVASQSERPDLPWHFGVIESGDINAFAAPGGYIFLTRGLYARLDSEAELAGVLAHEVGHVVRKHHLKLLQKSQLIDLGAQLLGKELGKDEKSLQKLIGSGAEMMARSLDKDAEYEADRMGMVIAARSGYDPFGLPAVLQEIGHASGSDVALLFKTHPHPDDRIAHLDAAAGERLDKVKGKTLENRFYRLAGKK
jgi:predicted Zn-dependent protease